MGLGEQTEESTNRVRSNERLEEGSGESESLQRPGSPNESRKTRHPRVHANVAEPDFELMRGGNQ